MLVKLNGRDRYRQSEESLKPICHLTEDKPANVNTRETELWQKHFNESELWLGGSLYLITKHGKRVTWHRLVKQKWYQDQ